MTELQTVPRQPLPDGWEALVEQSRAVRQHAYAPFSNFQVGAALQVEGGEVFTGCNVENSSYGLTICAERSAAVAAVSAGFRDFRAISISLSGSPVPCGACRQFLYEFNPNLLCLLDRIGDSEPPVCARLNDLLPGGFHLSN